MKQERFGRAACRRRQLMDVIKPRCGERIPPSAFPLPCSRPQPGSALLRVWPITPTATGILVAGRRLAQAMNTTVVEPIVAVASSSLAGKLPSLPASGSQRVDLELPQYANSPLLPSWLTDHLTSTTGYPISNCPSPSIAQRGRSWPRSIGTASRRDRSGPDLALHPTVPGRSWMAHILWTGLGWHSACTPLSLASRFQRASRSARAQPAAHLRPGISSFSPPRAKGHCRQGRPTVAPSNSQHRPRLP